LIGATSFRRRGTGTLRAEGGSARVSAFSLPNSPASSRMMGVPGSNAPRIACPIESKPEAGACSQARGALEDAMNAAALTEVELTR